MRRLITELNTVVLSGLFGVYRITDQEVVGSNVNCAFFADVDENIQKWVLNEINSEIVLYFPHTFASGLAQLSNRCRWYPIERSLDIGIWLNSDVNVLSKKNWFWGVKQPKLNYLPPVFSYGSDLNYPKGTWAKYFARKWYKMYCKTKF